MARIAGVDLPNNKRGEIGLTYIFGIGRSSARKILSQLEIDFDTKGEKAKELMSENDEVKNLVKDFGLDIK